MKCQRHDELTILSNRWSGADERANASIVPIHSLVPTNHLVVVVVVLSLITGRYVFMHINYLEPKPLILRGLRVVLSAAELLLFLDTLPTPLTLFCSRVGEKESAFPLSPFRDYCISINQIICIEGGVKNSWPPPFSEEGGGFN